MQTTPQMLLEISLAGFTLTTQQLDMAEAATLPHQMLDGTETAGSSLIMAAQKAYFVEAN